MDIQSIFANNREWVTHKLNRDPEYFKKLSKGQDPDILYIGCSDSRVTAEELMGVQPGDVFVLRNIANLVPNTDLCALSVIDFAVRHLKVDHIVICGHYYCGGVKAAMQSDDLGVLNPWLRNIKDVYRLHIDELSKITDEEKKYKRLVELNVREQCINVLKISSVQSAYRMRNIKVHGWVFDIQSGRLIDLEIEVKKVMENIMGIYHLEKSL